MKNTVKYWFWLVVGMCLMSIQIYKYLSNTLEYVWQEAVVLFVAMMLMIKPTAIPDLIVKMFNKK